MKLPSRMKLQGASFNYGAGDKETKGRNRRHSPEHRCPVRVPRGRHRGNRPKLACRSLRLPGHLVG